MERVLVKRSYYPELDGVRAMAAVMVMVFHAAQMLRPRPGIAALGQTGVDLFFVLSGLSDYLHPVGRGTS